MLLVRTALFLSVCSLAVCQELPHAAASPSSAVAEYESFFRTVMQRGRTVVTAPDGPAAAPLTIQAALGFTDSEMESLNRIAASCEARLNAIGQVAARGLFEARLEAIETGKVSTVDQQFKDRETQVARVVEQATQELKSALGDARFKKFDDWLRAGGAKGCWIAPCQALRR